MRDSIIKNIAIFGLVIALTSVLSINIYEIWFGVDARFEKRMQEYYRFNIQHKCDIGDTDYMKTVWAKISNCLDDKDKTIRELNGIIHQL